MLAGLAFLPDLPRDELIAALRTRVANLRAEAEDSRTMAADIHADGAGGVPDHVADSYDLIARLRDAEADWARALADRLGNHAAS